MQKLRVLLADDEDALRMAFKRVLEARGMDVVGEASNGAEVVEMSAKIHSDLVLTDLRMPLMDGIQAARIITSRSPHPAVIIVSAYADPSLQEEARLAGATGWLQKGLRGKQLCEQVYALMERAPG